MWGGGKLLSGIKVMYVDSLTCVKVKGGESERLGFTVGGDRVASCLLR